MTSQSHASYDAYVATMESHLLDFQRRNVTDSGVFLSRSEQDQTFPVEPTGDLVMQLCIAGSAQIRNFSAGFARYDGKFTDGDWVVVAPGSGLTSDGFGHYCGLNLSLPFDRVSEDLERFAGSPIRHFGLLHDRINKDVLTNAILRDLWCNQRLTELQVDSIVAMLMVRLTILAGYGKRQATGTTKLGTVRLSKTLEYIHDNVEHSVSLLRLAEISGLSQFHFTRAFANSTGFTPHQYLLRLRVESAKQAIRRGIPLRLTARSCGFADQAHLTRSFKKVVGLTPGQYLSKVT